MLASANASIRPAAKLQLFTRQTKKLGKWNQIEILVHGDHIRLVSNGQLVMDGTEADPQLIEQGPLGLQLHNNQQPEDAATRRKSA